MTRRSYYTRASDVTVYDAATGEPIGRQRRYSPSELNTVKSNKRRRRVQQIVANKISAPHPVLDTYLDTINADN